MLIETTQDVEALERDLDEPLSWEMNPEQRQLATRRREAMQNQNAAAAMMSAFGGSR